MISKRIKKPGQKQNGFTLIEALLSLLICSLVASLCAAQCQAIGSALPQSASTQNQFAIVQLREIAASSKRVSVENGALVLEREGKTETIRFDRNRLVKTPGYEIFAENIQSARFIQNGSAIDLEINDENTTGTWQIR